MSLTNWVISYLALGGTTVSWVMMYCSRRLMNIYRKLYTQEPLTPKESRTLERVIRRGEKRDQ